MTITYHKSHSFTKKGIKYFFQTELYKIGVYGILNNNPNNQGSYNPMDILKIEKKLLKDNTISNLKFGESITVTDKSGFWEEIIEKNNSSSINVLKTIKKITEEIK